MARQAGFDHFAVEPAFRRSRAELAGDRGDDRETDVVSGSLVTAARIAQPNHKFHIQPGVSPSPGSMGSTLLGFFFLLLRSDHLWLARHGFARALFRQLGRHDALHRHRFEVVHQ